jgi:putative transposase
MRYRRSSTPGATYFFTLVTKDRRPLFASLEAVDLLRNAFRTVRATRPFDVDAIVVLPDHLHCLWTLPENDADFATRWRLIKTWFTKHCDQARRQGEGGIWQPRYWEHLLRDETDVIRHADYIHYNPVKHGLVASAGEWAYSSFHRFVERGVYPADWGRAEMDFRGVGNE